MSPLRPRLTAALVASLLTALSGCGIAGVEGNGQLTQEERAVTGFSRVRSELPLDVIVRPGEPHVEVRVDENLQALIRVQVIGDTLVLDETAPFWRQSVGAKVEVTVPTVQAATLGGSGLLDVEAAGVVPLITLKASGSGELRYVGDAQALDSDSSGSGELGATFPSGRVLTRLDMAHSGSGDARIDAATERVTLFSSGSGNVELVGASGGRIEVESSGSGTVDARALPCATSKIALSGSGDVSATVEGGQVDVSLSGSGNVHLWGEPAVTWLSHSGSGNVTRH